MTNKELTRILLVGPPLSGKTTNRKTLEEQYGVPAISSGEILRHIEEHIPDHRYYKEIVAATHGGVYLEDDIMLEIMFEHLPKDGFILDGFPRTPKQAEMLYTIAAEAGKPISQVVLLDVPDNVILERLFKNKENLAIGVSSDRGNRPDDELKTVKTRLELYRTVTEPIPSYFQQQGIPVETVDATLDKLDVKRQILLTVESFSQYADTSRKAVENGISMAMN